MTEATLVAANVRIGHDKTKTMRRFVDPCGKVVVCLGERLVTHCADVREAVLKSRTEAFFGLNLLQDRRSECYGSVVDQSHRFPGEAHHPAVSDNAKGPSLAKLARRA